MRAQHCILSRREEQALARRARAGDKQAFDHLVMHNIRLVYSVARRYSPGPLPLDDLVQEGMLGLIRAAEKFDPDRGFKFSTYAVWWIRQAVQRGLQQKARTIRVPAHLRDQVPDALSLDRLRSDGDSVGEAAVRRDVATDFSEQAIDRAELYGALARLPEQSRQVLTLRYGFEGGVELSQAEIGRRLGVSRERVRRLEADALKALREVLAA